MAGLGSADWTPRGKPQQVLGRQVAAPRRRQRSDGSHGRSQPPPVEEGCVSQAVPSRHDCKQGMPRRRRATEPGVASVEQPPRGEYRAVGDGVWSVSTVSKEWLFKSSTGIYFHCPSETLWRMDQTGRAFQRVDPSAALESVALAALGDSDTGRRAFLRVCLLAWSRQRHKFDDMDKDLAQGCAAESSPQRRPRISAPRAADRGDWWGAKAASRFSNFVAEVSDGASLALEAASAGTSSAVAGTAAALANRTSPAAPQRRQSPSTSSRSSGSSRSNSSGSAGSWQPRHGAPPLVVRRGPPDGRGHSGSSPSRSKTGAKPSQQYLGAVHVAPRRKR